MVNGIQVVCFIQLMNAIQNFAASGGAKVSTRQVTGHELGQGIKQFKKMFSGCIAYGHNFSKLQECSIFIGELFEQIRAR